MCADGTEFVAPAAVFVDGTYEGDLMAAAGVPWRVGREGKDEYGESLAPEKPDGQLQAYNFRFVMTREPGNRVAVPAPPGYDRGAVLDVLDVIKEGRLRSVFGYPSECAFKAQVPPLPNDDAIQSARPPAAVGDVWTGPCWSGGERAVPIASGSR